MLRSLIVRLFSDNCSADQSIYLVNKESTKPRILVVPVKKDHGYFKNIDFYLITVQTRHNYSLLMALELFDCWKKLFRCARSMETENVS